MKKYVYPMVLFADENEMYTALYPDLDLLASGTSVEDVYLRANEYLDFFIESTLKYEAKVNSPSTYSQIQALNPNKVVLLGTAAIDESAIVLTEQEQAEKNFLKEFIYTEEGE